MQGGPYRGYMIDIWLLHHRRHSFIVSTIDLTWGKGGTMKFWISRYGYSRLGHRPLSKLEIRMFLPYGLKIEVQSTDVLLEEGQIPCVRHSFVRAIEAVLTGDGEVRALHSRIRVHFGIRMRICFPLACQVAEDRYRCRHDAVPDCAVDDSSRYPRIDGVVVCEVLPQSRVVNSRHISAQLHRRLDKSQGPLTDHANPIATITLLTGRESSDSLLKSRLLHTPAPLNVEFVMSNLERQQILPPPTSSSGGGMPSTQTTPS